MPTNESSTRPKGPNKAYGKISIGEIIYKIDKMIPTNLPFWYKVAIPYLENVHFRILGNRLKVSLNDLKNYLIF